VVDDDVPKLPRGRGFKLSTPEIIKILVTAGMLVAVIVLARPCGHAVSNFVMKFDNGSGSAKGSAAPQPQTVKPPEHYELITPDMTEEQKKAAYEREKARAKAAAGTGSTAGSGSALPQ
jgi:hypothetical protein